MQGKAANHSTDNPIFRGRIGAQTLLPAAEESQQLAGKNIDHGEIFITQKARNPGHSSTVSPSRASSLGTFSPINILARPSFFSSNSRIRSDS